MHQIHSGVLEKISSLLYSLTLTNKELSLVAEEIDDHNLKIALEGLSTESCQFAEELFTHLQSMGILVCKPDSLENPSGANEEEIIPGPGSEVAYICKKHEHSVNLAYTSVLNERLPFPVIGEILKLQFQAIMDGFMKLRLLNTSRFALS